MNATDAIRQMMKRASLGPSELSRRIGKARTYIASTLSHGSTPKVDTVARIAHECGYRLILRNDESGDELELYDEQDAQNYARELVSNLPSNVNLGDLVKALEDASFSEARPAKTDEPVSWEDAGGGVVTAEPSMSAKDLGHIGRLTTDGGDPSGIKARISSPNHKSAERDSNQS